MPPTVHMRKSLREMWDDINDELYELNVSADDNSDNVKLDNLKNLVIGNLNINGWTDFNSELRKQVIISNNPDIFCIQETHVGEPCNIELEGYTFYNHPRSFRHKDAPFHSGGVGILVHNDLFKNFDIDITDKE